MSGEESNIFPAKVVNVSSDHEEVTINKGEQDGIQKGHRFLIYALGDELFDPDTNVSLGKLEIVRGVGRVSHVMPRMATITSITTQKVKRAHTGFNALINPMLEETEIVPFKYPDKGDMAKPI